LAEERELRWQLQELRAELGRKANQVIEAETRVEMLQDKIKQVQNEKGGSSASRFVKSGAFSPADFELTHSF
jgi:hypothetical protein